MLLVAAATHRVTRTITKDRIAGPLRDWFDKRGETGEYFVRCPWCVSMYVALTLAGAASAFPRSRVLNVLLLALAASALAGDLALLEGVEEEVIDDDG